MCKIPAFREKRKPEFLQLVQYECFVANIDAPLGLCYNTKRFRKENDT